MLYKIPNFFRETIVEEERDAVLYLKGVGSVVWKYSLDIINPDTLKESVQMAGKSFHSISSPEEWKNILKEIKKRRLAVDKVLANSFRLDNLNPGKVSFDSNEAFSDLQWADDGITKSRFGIITNSPAIHKGKPVFLRTQATEKELTGFLGV